MSLSVDTFFRDHPFKNFCYLTRKQFVRKYFKFDRSNCLFITSQKCTYHQGVRTLTITLKDFYVVFSEVYHRQRRLGSANNLSQGKPWL